jgi:hypothetical protein
MNEDSDSDDGYKEAVQSIDEFSGGEYSKEEIQIDYGDEDNGPMGVIPNSSLAGELRKLTTSYNPKAGAHLKTALLTKELCLNIAGFDDRS